METYYQLVDKDTSTISVWWKVMHIFCFVIVIITGYITAHSFGRAVEWFGDNCILFATISFIPVTNETKKHLLYGLRELPSNLTPINIIKSDWGAVSMCYFCQFTPLMCMITGIVWGTFFIMMAKGGAGYISDMMYGAWKVVYPALALAATATVLMLISTLKLHDGILTFCSNFDPIFQITSCTRDINEYTLAFSERKRDLIGVLKTSLICSYICFSAWVLQLGILILRIINIVDFELIQITVLTVTGEEAELATVEPDNKSFDSSTLSTIVESESAPDSTPKQNRRVSHFGVKKRASVFQKPTALAAPPKSALKKSKNIRPKDDQHVAYIDESPTNEGRTNTATSPLISPKKKDFYIHEMYRTDDPKTDATATTSFSTGKDHISPSSSSTNTPPSSSSTQTTNPSGSSPYTAKKHEKD